MDLFVVRALERTLAVGVGALAIYLGYRLFLAVKATGEGSAEVKLPADVTVMLSRVGPGVFFALFGALVVGTSFAYPIRYSEAESRTADQVTLRTKEVSGIAPSAESSAGPGAETGTLRPASVPSGEALEAERLRVSRYIAFVNQTTSLLDPSLSDPQRQRARTEASAAKLHLMRQVWAPDWGEIESFQLWVEGGGPARDTAEFRAAEKYFLAGAQEVTS
jgi:hypothetical protein